MSQTNSGAKRPATASQRAAASRARRLEREQGRQVGVILPPDAVSALDRLQARGYASSVTACISRAIVEAESRE